MSDAEAMARATLADLRIASPAAAARVCVDVLSTLATAPMTRYERDAFTAEVARLQRDGGSE